MVAVVDLQRRGGVAARLKRGTTGLGGSFGPMLDADAQHRERCLVERVFGRAPTKLHRLTAVRSEGGAKHSEGLFEIQGNIARHVGTLRSISVSEVQALAESVLGAHDVRFVLFEDCTVTCDRQSVSGRPQYHFRYKANWRRDIEPGAQYLSDRQQRRTDKKLSRLTELLGSAPRHVFRETVPSDIDLIEGLNRKKVEGRGQRYRFTSLRRRLLKEVASQLGHTSILEHEGRIIAGCIVYVAGTHAYFALQGFDTEFHKYSPGILLQLKTLDACAALGCDEANYLWGDGRWKSDLGAKRECLDTVLVARSRSDLIRPECLRLIAPHVHASLRHGVKRRVQDLSHAKNAWQTYLKRRFRTGVGGRK